MACDVRCSPQSNMHPILQSKESPYDEFSADGKQWVNGLSQPWGPPHALGSISLVEKLTPWRAGFVGRKVRVSVLLTPSGNSEPRAL
jgi:hypothetical protein